MKQPNQWELRGRVRVCWMERRMDEWVHRSTEEFREDRQLLSYRHCNADGSECSGTHEYDEAGQLVATPSVDSNGNAYSFVYEYDALGRLTKVIQETAAGKRIHETYEYDASGRKSRTQHMDIAPEKENMLYSFAVEGSSCSYSVRGAASVTTLYNEREQPAEVQVYNPEGVLLTRIVFSYDEHGNLIEEAQSNTWLGLIPANALEALSAEEVEEVRSRLDRLGSRQMHKYDEQGRRVETQRDYWGLGISTQTWSYNEHGDEIGTVTEERQNEGVVNRSEGRTQYEYDAQGNWVVKTRESRTLPDGEFQTTLVEKRQLEYFA